MKTEEIKALANELVPLLDTDGATRVIVELIRQETAREGMEHRHGPRPN